MGFNHLEGGAKRRKDASNKEIPSKRLAREGPKKVRGEKGTAQQRPAKKSRTLRGHP